MRLAGFIVLVLVANSAISEKRYSPVFSQTYPQNVYWGDTHVHSNLSFDAYAFGNRKLGPEQAYRFAMGEAVLASDGLTAQLKRPLDFLVVADHASNLGVLQCLEGGHSEGLVIRAGERMAGKDKRF